MDHFFFFSSRRRHTRWTGDWSSDVCSSDLLAAAIAYGYTHSAKFRKAVQSMGHALEGVGKAAGRFFKSLLRSEERRVGKECRSRGSPDLYRKKRPPIGVSAAAH